MVGDGRKLGVAQDFNFNNDTYLVSHIIVRAARWQRLRMTQLMFERRQITGLDNRQITVDIGPQTQRLTSLGSNPA